jgi:CRISPR-associated protein Cas1
MIGRVVEIAADNRHISRERGFLVVSESGEEIGRIPLDGVAAVIGNGHGLTYSGNLVAALAERCIPFIICGPHHRPVAFLWPADGHHNQAGRMAAQASAGKPLKKRLWQEIVRAKIEQQAATLDQAGAPSGGFALLARKVKSGDPENVEAQAARRYWPLLLGEDFRRRRDAGGVNGLLNYAYAVLRAGAARAVMAAGLHPSLGLAHSNPSNPFCLVDDCMEPFRPVADLLVLDLVRRGAVEVTPETKPDLSKVLTLDMSSPEGATPVITCLERLAFSLAQCFAGERKSIDLPQRPLPLLR